MFEMIGDFDTGKDTFDGNQRASTVGVIALLQEHFGLPAQSLRFHNSMSAKSCPGSAINYPEVVAEVEGLRASGMGAAARGLEDDGPFPGEQAAVIANALKSLSRVTDTGSE